MVYLGMVVLYLHILAGIAWFGSSIFIIFVMIPTLRRMGATAVKEYLQAMEFASQRFFPAAGGSTVLLGIVRGLLFGVSLNTAYGKTYLAAIVLGVGILIYGVRVTGMNVRRMSAAPAGPEQAALIEHTYRFGFIEFAGFLVLLGLMIAMRFGY